MAQGAGSPAAPTADDPAVRRGVIGWFVRAAFGMPLVGLLLFGFAGTVHWAWGWLFYGLGLLVTFAHGLSLAYFNPALLAQRSRGTREPGAQAWDRAIVTLGAGILPYTAWIVAALDFRHGWSAGMPAGLRVAATVAWLLAWALILWATIANRFCTAMVRIQPGHRVESGGPYRFVRHPLYAGAVVYQTLSPIILGSWWALVPALGAAACYVVRAALEDAFLRERLDGYAAYAARVRYRLLPAVW